MKAINGVTDLDRLELPTATQQLNKIAKDWTAEDGLLGETSRTEVETLCDTISEDIEEWIERYKKETSFSDREAEAWTLQHYRDEHGAQLTRESIAIYISIVYGDGDWLTRQAIDSYVERAEQKLEKARQTLSESSFPEGSNMPPEPSIVWLDESTTMKLRKLAEEGEEQTIDDVISQRIAEMEDNQDPI